MIPLFHLNNYVIDTAKLGNHLHGIVVEQFVQEFCQYVGAKHGCALSSATDAIFLTFDGMHNNITIPTILPPVVANALLNGGNSVRYEDNPDWVGHSYTLHDFGDCKIIDSAQRVDRNQFSEANDSDIMIFSFYPTKPVGGMDGGIVVSNDKDRIEYFRHRSLNGMSFSENNWERKQISIGWKMYMKSFQAHVALQNLRKLDEKKEHLAGVRKVYNSKFGLNNTSDHLYRINVEDREKVMSELKEAGIMTGIHYQPLHEMPLHKQEVALERSEKDGRTTLSIPFNEKLTVNDVNHIVTQIKKHVTI